MGPVYGHQWRFFNAKYDNCNTNYKNHGIDQLQNIINMLQDPVERYSRRIIMTSWNPVQINEMALPPCHVLSQFKVNNNNELSCILYQRSGDIGLGIPFNIASYAFLTHLLARHCNLETKEFIHFIGDAHIYDDHSEILQKQIKRNPNIFPRIYIKNKYNSIDDYKLNDFNVENYIYHDSLKMNMRV